MAIIRYFLFFLLGLIFAGPTQASELKRLEGLVSTVEAWIPDKSKLGCVIGTLKDVAGIEKYNSDAKLQSANIGFSSHIKERLNCSLPLNQSAFSFYRKLAGYREGLQDRLALTGAEYLMGLRPTLVDEAGAGRNKNIKPNAIFELAIEAAGGSPSLAIATIGICGNDDISGNIELPKTKTSQAEAEFYFDEVILSDYMNETKLDDFSLNKERADSLLNTIARIQKKLDSTQRKSDCQAIEEPTEQARVLCAGPHSALFVPGAVGPVLSESLRKKIEQIQAPTKGGNYLPGKNYHLLMGAYLGCELSRCGIGSGLAERIARTFGRTYRLVRLKVKNRSIDYYVSKFEEEKGIRWDDPKVPELDEYRIAGKEKADAWWPSGWSI